MEFNEQTSYPAVVFMPEINAKVMGGTMRLGSRPTIIANQASVASKVYGFTDSDDDQSDPEQNKKPRCESIIYERHRHRYEVNPEKIKELESHGLVFSGRDESSLRMEIVEIGLESHPFYFGTQFHPEFKSRPNRPSPPFYAFMAVCASKTEAIGLAGNSKVELMPFYVLIDITNMNYVL